MAEGSAIVGMPPNTDRDVLIIRGWYWRFGLVEADPNMGFLMVAQRPEDYTFSSRQPGIIAAMVAVMLIIIVPTVARLVVRARSQNARLGLDDWTISLAAIIALMYPILQLVAAVKGRGGRHVWEATYEHYQELAYYLGISRIFYYIATGLIKISIALFVRRLCERASRVWRIMADVFMGTVFLYIIAGMLCFFLICSPYRAAYDMAYAGAQSEPIQCGDGVMRDKALSVTHVVQGGLLLLAPIIILWKIQMNLGKKLRLFFIWITGALTVMGGLLQFFLVVVITDDIFYQYSRILVWTSIDLCLGLLTASLPVLDGAIMGSLTKVKTALSSGSANRSHALTSGGPPDHFSKSQTTTSVVRGRPRKDDSDSIEAIMNKDDGTEMAILRTDEIHLGYESSKDQRPWRGGDLETARAI